MWFSFITVTIIKLLVSFPTLVQKQKPKHLACFDNAPRRREIFESKRTSIEAFDTTATTMAPSVAFLGLGIMGEAMARNILHKTQCRVIVWNRTASKCDSLVKEGAEAAASPAEAVSRCDITFAMLADPTAAKNVVFGPKGVLEGLSPGKAYVDMSTVAAETSREIAAAVKKTGASFLEAPVSGSKQPAIDGQLIILAAGDAHVFGAAQPMFDAMGKRSFLLSTEVGAGARMKLVVNAIMGTMMAALSEGVALADNSGLDASILLEVLGLGAMQNPMFAMKGPLLASGAGTYPPAFPLKHQQKDLRLALALAEQSAQPLQVTAAANEVFKRAKALGRGEDDFSAVYEAVRTLPAATKGASIVGMGGKVSSLASFGTDQAVPQDMESS
jgi:glyoxylate/succinic semialdehyde reductase